MKLPPIVPPIKCQGIKTKLVEEIKSLTANVNFDRWVEPFCGSSVVAFNMKPKRALLCDTNIHIIELYNDIKKKNITSQIAREFLYENGKILSEKGEDYYYEVRERFNKSPSSLDFLFLNRSCFNGVMRFNRHGKFNVPYCHKKDRFAQAYITKIANQINAVSIIIANSDFVFEVADFRNTLSCVEKNDLIYADPPYSGRHVDYFNSWSTDDEVNLASFLKDLSCKFILSTWHSNEFRVNNLIKENWVYPKFHVFTKKHFYHVGSTESLRHPMIEALVTNFEALSFKRSDIEPKQISFLEQAV